MSNEEEQEEKPEFGQFSITDSNTPDFFANMSIASVSQTDVIIFFGRQLQDHSSGKRVTNPLARITVTHENFIKMVKYWSEYSKFLEMVYGEGRPSLRYARQRDPELFDKAVQSLLHEEDEDDQEEE